MYFLIMVWNDNLDDVIGMPREVEHTEPDRTERCSETAAPSASHQPWMNRRTFLSGSAAMLGAGVVSTSNVVGASAGVTDRTDAVRTDTGAGMVSTVHPQATRVGREVLSSGGNAVDAAVAVQFALNVVQPHTSGIGGGGFMLVYAAAEDELYAIDCREAAPSGASPEMFLNESGEPVPFKERHTNGKAVGVPGTLRACDVALKRFGTRDMSELICPSIDLADGGTTVTVDAFLAEAIRSNVEDGTLTDETMSVFAPNGTPLGEGDRLIQPDLADTLRSIREDGSAAFYKGEIASDIAETVQHAAGFRDEGGSMDEEDLARYNVDISIPEYATYDGAAETVTVRTMSLPSSGGLTIGQILALLEPLDLAAAGPNAVETYHRLLSVFRRAYADRGAFMGDSAFVDVPWQGLLDADYLDKRREMLPGIDEQVPGEEPTPGDPWSFQPGGPYRTISDGAAVGGETGQRGQTTHFTVADSDGNLVSWTTTIEQLFGSGIMVPGRGFMLNNELTDFDAKPGGPNEVRPGKRPLSSTSPTIVFQDGDPFFTVGSPGGKTIITTVARVILNISEFGMSVPEAIAAPRVYQDAALNSRFEPFVSTDVRSGLGDLGYQFNEETITQLGNVQLIRVRDDGSYQGAGDFRRNSAVGGVQ